MRPPLLIAAVLIASPIAAMASSGLNVSFHDEDGLATDCSAMSVRYDGQRLPVISEEVPVAGLNSLRVRNDGNGGIRVIGTEGATYAVRLCKAVGPSLDPGQVRASVNGDQVSASGPDSERWVAYFIVQTPRNATLDLQSANGPISVRRFEGKLTVRAENGPLALKESSGTVEATATNGPISVAGGSGNMKLEATNGPISVKLSGASWDGNLDASTENGPVSLRLPRGFRSGVVIESHGGGPVHCRAEGCASTDMSEDDDSPRRIQLGSGPTSVHISTVNGPINVRDME